MVTHFGEVARISHAPYSIGLGLIFPISTISTPKRFDLGQPNLVWYHM